MQHDITHCANDNCPSKTHCYRYIAHLDACKNNLTYLTYTGVFKDTELKDGKCVIYWPYEASNV